MYKTVFIQVKHKDKILFGYLSTSNNPINAVCDIFHGVKNRAEMPKDIDFTDIQYIDVTASINDNLATYSFVLYYDETDKGFQNEVMHTVLDLIDHLWED